MSDSTPTPPLLPDPSHEAGSAATRTILLGMARPSLRVDCAFVPSGPREGDVVLQPDASGCMMPDMQDPRTLAAKQAQGRMYRPDVEGEVVFGEPEQRGPRMPITLTERWQVEALVGCKVAPVGSAYPAGVLTRCDDFMMSIGGMAYAWRCHKVELLALPERAFDYGPAVEVSPVGGRGGGKSQAVADFAEVRESVRGAPEVRAHKDPPKRGDVLMLKNRYAVEELVGRLVTLTDRNRWLQENVIMCRVRGFRQGACVLDCGDVTGDVEHPLPVEVIVIDHAPERVSTVLLTLPDHATQVSDPKAKRAAWMRMTNVGQGSEVPAENAVDEVSLVADNPLAVQSKCEHCNDTGILRGFGFGTSVDACDRPCGCKPAKVEGPSEWTITKREEVKPGDYWAPDDGVWNIEARKGDAVFVGFVSKSRRYTRVARKPWGYAGETVLEIHNEKAPDMAIARLLCGLRDGTVKP